MRALDTVLNQLPNARPYGQRYRASCPVHQRTKRHSLSIREADDGRVLLHCFGGCETRDIVEALGLRWSDLFAEPLPSLQRRARRFIRIDPDKLKNKARHQITAATLYAALLIRAILKDELPPFPCDERLGCYVGLGKTLWTLVILEGTEAARTQWQAWQSDLRHTAPRLLAMVERIGAHAAY